MSTETVCGTDDNDEDGVYPTWEAAFAAALKAAGPGGSIVVHMSSCPYEASTGIGRNCTPEVHRNEGAAS